MRHSQQSGVTTVMASAPNSLEIFRILTCHGFTTTLSSPSMSERFASNTFYPHYETGTATYKSVNSFKKEISRLGLKLAPTLTSNSVVLDNACIPGFVTGEIESLFSAGASPKIHAVDFAPAMITTLKQKTEAEGWTGVEAAVTDARTHIWVFALAPVAGTTLTVKPLAEELSFSIDLPTHSITNFGLFFSPQPEKELQEIFRTLSPGCVALVTS